MLRRWSLVSAAAVIALLVLAHQPALADHHEGDDATERMTLPSGAVVINLPLEANMSSGSVFKPASIAPDLWYGLSDSLSVGIVHSSYGTTGLYGGAGAGICVTGEDSGCSKPYDNVGLDVRLGLLDGSLPIALDVGGYVLSLDQFTVSAKAGLVGKLGLGPIAVLFAPNVFVGITDRDLGNEQNLNLPVSLVLGLGSSLSLGVQSGIQSPLSGFGDNFVVPVSAGARFMVSKLAVDVAFSFPQIAGGADGTGTDARTLTAAIGFAL